MGDTWELIYWPGIKGRGEYIRLMFEEAGVPYVDWAHKEGAHQAIIDFVWSGGNKDFPITAPPAIKKGDFVLCNTPVVMSYLNTQFGWDPASAADKAHMDQVLAIIADAVSEGRLAFHPKDFYASHKGQEEASQPYIEQYGTKRLPRYMRYIDTLLQRAGGSGHLIAGQLTAADLAVYHFLAAAQQHYGQYYDQVEDAPLAKAFKDSMAARPRIAAYLASDRCPPWDKDSMM